MRVWLGLFLLLCFGCDPTLPIPSQHGPSAASSLTLAFEPSASADSVPPIVWIEVSAAGAELGPNDVALIHGSVTDLQLRQLARGQPSAELQSRSVAVTSFVRNDKLVVAPTAPLGNGPYVIALGRLGSTAEIAVHGTPRSFPLERVWPPRDEPGAASALVYCAPYAFARFALPLTLEPGGLSGSFWGGGADGMSRRCIHFEVDPNASSSTAVLSPPPTLTTPTRVWSVDPTPLQVVTDAPVPIDRVECSEGELQIGPGCAFVDDDRLTVTPPQAPLLWTLVGSGIDHYVTSRDGEPFIVKGVRPASDLSLEVIAMDSSGQVESSTFNAITSARHAHLVLNEVYANPVGPEPAQEFVEIYNDGALDGNLGGLSIDDVGGETVLPDTIISAGGFALVVPAAFSPTEDFDPQPPPGALLVRVPKLGKNGLSDGGKPLKLTTGDGIVLSRFPAAPKPKSGVSVARVTPSAPDGAASSFALSADGASPAAPNQTE